MSNRLIELSKSGHTSNPPLLLLWFSAQWCGPCRTMIPVFNQAQDSYAEVMNIIKVDVDQEQQLVSEFGIRAVPSFVLVGPNGVVDSRSGLAGYEELSQWFDHHLATFQN
ncbi:thioredoxin family protein [Pseudoteredinibacter isoporae]|uniref:Thioredoxin-like negative regulator of GroEL n=1 Tax=Pseudoteredinibacter isoporae TaxID=570281 RepID=A0A7X0JV20_9GAMM|nr:thioredoxin family protein [Pseudoteredinibacter isoporae]MBB6522248.1 thioredoxin-like negative regulator of GroEL [Pseudoteredinibacter isoporae]NHO87782.1 thioredoxin family protein [Pseudoteredinibacter isoporae]NIB23887.1 thioredoxin family protein [Pseudoteredinibacter isoporae]